MQVVTVNVIPKFAQVLSHFFILFSSFSSGWLISIFWSYASKILLLLLMLSVAFFILLHFIHCNLKQQNFCLVPSLFFASLHSLRNLFFCLIAQLSDQDRIQAQ